MRARWHVWLPLTVFALFCVLVLRQMAAPADREVESQMIGKPLPEFDLVPANPEVPGLATQDFKDGKPRLLNIWASWCIPCAAEAPQLEALRRQGVDVVGVAVRDTPRDVANFLGQYGNPYSRIGADDVSQVQLAIGSSGVPETFVIDGQGIIRYQHIGDIREPDVPLLIQKLKEANR